MLEAQRIYGDRRPCVRSAERAAFGICLHSTLPEDEADRQPLQIEGHLLVADVRLDNRDELARSLGLPTELRAAPDSELLLRAWLRWNDSCLDRIVGDFAFAIYEVGARKLTLVRDIIGQRPMFFARHGESIAFASMTSGLLALPQFRKGFNHRGLALAAADVPLEDNSTYFQSIHRVMPGQVVTFTAGELKSRDYWQPNLDQLRFKAAGDYVDAYRSVLDEAVRPHLRRLPGPIATHLSSGLDSSAVAATAARLKLPGDTIFAFTAAPRPGFHERSPRGRLADESTVAARTARMHGMRHEVVRTGGSSLKLIRSLVATSQEPSCNILNQDWFWSIERLARGKGATTLLTGEYGNATLNSGGLRVLAEWIRTLHWATWWKEAWCAARSADVHWRGILFNSFEPWLPDAVRRSLYRYFLDVENRSRSVFLTEPWLREIGDRIESDFLTNPAGSLAEARLRMLRRSDNGALLKGSLARHGIDNRSPLGDRRVVEFSLRLPPEQMYFEGVSQPLARKALSDRLPSEILSARTRGYQSADWFENIDPGDVRSIIEEIAANPTASTIVDVAKIDRALANWPRADVNRFGQYQRFSIDLPKALATGLFIIEAERWMSGRAPIPARLNRPGDHGPRDVPG